MRTHLFCYASQLSGIKKGRRVLALLRKERQGQEDTQCWSTAANRLALLTAPYVQQLFVHSGGSHTAVSPCYCVTVLLRVLSLCSSATRCEHNRWVRSVRTLSHSVFEALASCSIEDVRFHVGSLSLVPGERCIKTSSGDNSRPIFLHLLQSFW
jgi:hypothetical protein